MKALSGSLLPSLTRSVQCARCNKGGLSRPSFSFRHWHIKSVLRFPSSRLSFILVMRRLLQHDRATKSSFHAFWVAPSRCTLAMSHSRKWFRISEDCASALVSNSVPNLLIARRMALCPGPWLGAGTASGVALASGLALELTLVLGTFQGFLDIFSEFSKPYCHLSLVEVYSQL